MTDTTDIAALREFLQCEIIPNGILRNFANKALGLLEAERQRAAELKINWDAAKNSIQFYKAEIAAMKGDQVPVAVIQYSKHRELPGGSKPDWNEMPKVLSCNWLPDGTYDVYLHPQKPVVLHDERDHYQDTDEYEQGYVRGWNASRVEAKAAIKAAGGIVKDGE